MSETINLSLAEQMASLAIAARTNPEYKRNIQAIFDSCIEIARSAASEGKLSCEVTLEAEHADEIETELSFREFDVGRFAGTKTYKISWQRHVIYE